MLVDWIFWTVFLFTVLGGSATWILRFVTWGCRYLAGKEIQFGAFAQAGVWVASIPLAISLPAVYLHNSIWAIGVFLGICIWAFGVFIPSAHAKGILPKFQETKPPSVFR